ncbi:MAG: PilZ domain-containing protein [Deltaproteobacteria bacterium]|nr:PilZ domain-containing protein [Deltaproteobacteria bacterium]
MSDDLFERRQAERRYALNFLDYEVISDTDVVLGRGLARTLNVSESGLRLETSQFFEPGQKLRITLGLNNELIQVNGRVINSQPETDDLCSSGIMFLEFDEADRRTYQKHFDALKNAVEQ